MAATIGKRLDERVGRPNDKNTKECFPAYKRDARLQKFKRFNTAIPSSAAVERLFAVGSDILQSKRLSMTKKNLEKFVLLRENEKCLKKSIFLMNNELILNVSERSFFCFSVYLFLLLLFLLLFFCFSV